MKNRFLSPLLSLLSLISIIFFLTACGGGGSSGSASSPDPALAKDAVVTVGVDPSTFSREARKISGSTNYIELYVTQWQVHSLNTLTVINQYTDTLTAANPSATITLYPTYTRICASQYSGTPAAGAAPTEASCSFGILNSGNNTVTLTMLADTWTISPIYKGVGSMLLSYPTIATETTGSLSYGVYDGNTHNNNWTTNSAPGQGVNNWGNYYQVQFKDSSGNIVTGLSGFPAGSGAAAWAATPFNYGDTSGPSFGTGAETISGYYIKTDTFIGGIGTGVGSNGLISETKNAIIYPLDSTTPVLFSPTTTFEVQNQSGANVTGSIFSNCQLQVLSGSRIQACGITQIKNQITGTYTGSSDIQKGTPGSYNYMVTSTATLTGADICYSNGANAMTANGTIICYDYDFCGSNTCCSSGATYTTINGTGTCEYSLSSTCTSQFYGNNSSSVYNATTQSCTGTQVEYYNTLNSTALTLTAN